mgnify:CR=1 FL=1
MKIQKATPAEPVMDAVRHTVENSQQLAVWCGGGVRGIKLPPEERTVQFYNQEAGEQDASVGDWIVRRSNGTFIRHSDKEIRELNTIS